MTTHGEINWPPMGRFSCPLSPVTDHPRRVLRELDRRLVIPAQLWLGDLTGEDRRRSARLAALPSRSADAGGDQACGQDCVRLPILSPGLLDNVISRAALVLNAVINTALISLVMHAVRRPKLGSIPS